MNPTKDEEKMADHLREEYIVMHIPKVLIREQDLIEIPEEKGLVALQLFPDMIYTQILFNKGLGPFFNPNGSFPDARGSTTTAVVLKHLVRKVDAIFDSLAELDQQEEPPLVPPW